MNRQYTTTCSDTFQPRGHIERMEDKIILPRKETKAKCWDDILLLARHPREDKEMASPEDSSFKNQAAVCPPPPPAAGPAARRDSLQDMIMKCSEAEGRCWDDILSLAAATISNTSAPAVTAPPTTATAHTSLKAPVKSILRHSTGNIDDSDSYSFNASNNSLLDFNYSFTNNDHNSFKRHNKSVHFPLPPTPLVKSVHIRPRTDILDVPLLHYTPKDIKKFRREYERQERTEIFRRATVERLEREQEQLRHEREEEERRGHELRQKREGQLKRLQNQIVFRDVAWDDDDDVALDADVVKVTGDSKPHHRRRTVPSPSSTSTCDVSPRLRRSPPVHWPAPPTTSSSSPPSPLRNNNDNSKMLNNLLVEQYKTIDTLYLF